MKVLLSAVAWLAAATVAFAQGTDSCTTPTVITGAGPFAFNNSAATTGTQGQTESACLAYGYTTVANDVWFTWNSTFTGFATLNTCGLTSVDTKIGIYPGLTCPVAGSALACNDDACVGYQSTTGSFAVTMGLDYVIQIGTYLYASGGTGTFAINNVAPPPANDNCAMPTVITGAGPFAFDNTNATMGTQGQTEALCLQYSYTAVDKDVWYTWNATFSGYAQVDTCGIAGGVDTKVGIYPGLTCPTPGSALGCNDDSGCPGFASTTGPFLITMGLDYMVQIGTYGGGGAPGGIGMFAINAATPPPANDDCSAAITLPGPGTYAFDTTYATTGSQGQGTTTGCYSSVKKDLWYTYNATLNGTITVTTCGGLIASPEQDSKIAIYAGAGCPAGLGIACNDDDGSCTAGSTLNSTVSVPSTCGATYAIQVGNFFTTAPFVVGTFDVIETGSACATPYTVLCSGDGTDNPCPCGNVGGAGRGCENTASSGGAALASSGIASISADTLVLNSTFAVPFGPGLYYEGSTTANPAVPFGIAFGNGLRCAGGVTNRLEVRFADAAGAANSTVSLAAFGAAVAGNTYYYQLWYRDTGNVGTCMPGAGFNFSNAISLAWVP